MNRLIVLLAVVALALSFATPALAYTCLEPNYTSCEEGCVERYYQQIVIYGATNVPQYMACSDACVDRWCYDDFGPCNWPVIGWFCL